jgi:hypothetical protein
MLIAALLVVLVWSRICVIFMDPSQMSSKHLNKIDPRIASGDLRTLALVSVQYSSVGRPDGANRCEKLFKLTTPLLNGAGWCHTQLTCHGYYRLDAVADVPKFRKALVVWFCIQQVEALDEGSGYPRRVGEIYYVIYIMLSFMIV